MSVTIRVGDSEATVSRGMWTSDDKRLEFRLNWKEKIEVPPMTMVWDKDYFRAERAVKWLGGEVIRRDPVAEMDADTIY
jgi:hypothetical protein